MGSSFNLGKYNDYMLKAIMTGMSRHMWHHLWSSNGHKCVLKTWKDKLKSPSNPCVNVNVIG